MVWTNFQNSDTVGKFNPKTEKWVDIQTPSIGMETHQIGYLDDKDGGTKITVMSLRMSKVAYLEFRTQQEHEALRGKSHA